MKMSRRSRQGVPGSVPCLSAALLFLSALPHLVFSFWLSELPSLSHATLALFFFLFFKYISFYLLPFLSCLAVSCLCGSAVKFVLWQKPCVQAWPAVCCIVQRSPQSPYSLVKYEHLENPDSWFHTVCTVTGKGLPLSPCVQFLCLSGHNY